MLLIKYVFLREIVLIGVYFKKIVLISALGGKTGSQPSRSITVQN